MRSSRNAVLGACLALLLVFAACGSGEDGDTDTAGPEETTGCPVDGGDLTVGVSAAFTENKLVAEMYALALENCGYTVERQFEIGAREISDPALFDGEIDIKPEYLASELVFNDPDAEPSGDPGENHMALEPLLAEHGVTALDFSPATDENVFVVTGETAKKFKLVSVSDLGAPAKNMTLGGPPECPKRPFCLIGLKDVYGIEFGDFKALDVGGPQTVEALDKGAIDVALLFSTNPVIPDRGWIVLEDDKGLQSAENLTPLVRDDVLNDAITDTLNAVSAVLTTDYLTALIAKVDQDREDLADVARSFLEDAGVL
ncbi:MAG TPA: ABC transporter substrate-binding protein [Actinomycetota bacterium]|nr:ABC transporter substrate-binding protein [Actinomycetota bacterium]